MTIQPMNNYYLIIVIKGIYTDMAYEWTVVIEKLDFWTFLLELW